jgi:hypothetical protein
MALNNVSRDLAKMREDRAVTATEVDRSLKFILNPNSGSPQRTGPGRGVPAQQAPLLNRSVNLLYQLRDLSRRGFCRSPNHIQMDQHRTNHHSQHDIQRYGGLWRFN